MPKENKPIDWEGIERDYRAGAMSVRDIARWYSVSHTAINKKAKAEKWVRAEQPKHLDRREPVPRLTPALETTPDLTEKGKTLAGRMMDELDAVTSLHGELEDMICAEESDSRRRHALLKAISLGERAKTLKDISATLKTFNEAAAPAGKKAARKDAAAASAAGSGKFAQRPGPPKLVVDNK
jgi:thioredoxin-like negative regulator of GroEL